ncbi:MAG: 2OG-Fe(II) oxygenase [Piscirickettsiaceae bacterium]|jgi:SM-20-related protein|nr:2OG-Fe(II) oxygenase [Piscirickettsiaceae bacterium]
MINIDLLNKTPLKTEPFPYFSIEQSMLEDKLPQLIKEFPSIARGGSFNKEDLELSDNYEALHQALDSVDFRQALSEKFNVNVMTSPIMLTYRGFSRSKDGRVHTDSKTKLLTILIYFNEDWTAETGKLRILNSDNMDDIAEEVNPTAGCMIAFKVTDNCWHGYPSFEGTRNAIQVNFLASEAASKKHKFFHKMSAKLKSL